MGLRGGGAREEEEKERREGEAGRHGARVEGYGWRAGILHIFGGRIRRNFIKERKKLQRTYLFGDKNKMDFIP